MGRIRDLFFRWRRLPYVYDRVSEVYGVALRMDRRLEFIQEALGRIEARQLEGGGVNNLQKNEFRVFSQWGEDGIIQFLLRHVPITRPIFVEFGADNYNLESNTRFLLTNNNWSGLVIDGGAEAIRNIKHSSAYWLYNLNAVHAFITKDNINDLLRENGITGEIGILSIDIDGNDYWIWDAIYVINPAIVIIEYNHRFGDLSVTIPYQEDFERSKAHPSRMYFGASLKALWKLGDQKGYALVGCNRNGVNAFFVRKDKKPELLKTLTPEEGYMQGTFAETTELSDRVIKRSPTEETDIIKHLGLPLIDV